MIEQEVECSGRVYSLIYTPIPNAGYVNIYGRDITERKQAEKSLARQRELLQRVFDNIPVLLVMWEPALHRFTLNRRAETVLGWTTADANEGDFMSKVYPDPAYRAEVTAFMQSLSAGFQEFYTISKNGERIPIEWANVRLNDDTMIGIGVDLRERKRAEESLRARTEEIETLLQVSPIAFFVAYDPDCREITANPAGYRLVGLPDNVGANVSKSAPKEQQPSYRVFRDGVELASQELPMQMAARLGIDVVEESLELRFGDGSSKYIYSYARPLIGENGKPRGAIAAMLDITERKLADKKLRESEKRFRTLANTVPSIVWTSSPDGTITFTNDYWHKYTGSDPKSRRQNWTDYCTRMILNDLSRLGQMRSKITRTICLKPAYDAMMDNTVGSRPMHFPFKMTREI
jgi:PAS domain S-box-containing protein